MIGLNVPSDEDVGFLISDPLPDHIPILLNFVLNIYLVVLYKVTINHNYHHGHKKWRM